MRRYALLYDSNTDSWSVIVTDAYNPDWFVEHSGLPEDVARLVLRGLEADS